MSEKLSKKKGPLERSLENATIHFSETKVTLESHSHL